MWPGRKSYHMGWIGFTIIRLRLVRKIRCSLLCFSPKKLIETEALLILDHRSEGGRSAEPDSFLDRIADLFGGAPKPAPIQNKVQRRPVSPVYPGQAKPNPVFPGPLQSLQSQPSILQPQSVKPPAGFNPKRPVTKLQSSPSNAIKRQSAGKYLFLVKQVFFEEDPALYLVLWDLYIYHIMNMISLVYGFCLKMLT